MEQRIIAGIQTGVLGYGGMRFPLDTETFGIDEKKASALIRRAVEAGVTYFDSAWTYHGGQSEGFFARALAEYPRESYLLATKLPCWQVESSQQAEEIFFQQLRRLQTDYVDFYLLHALTGKAWRNMVQLGVVERMEVLQREGKIRRFGFSFHDSLDSFKEIITARRWDFCQIQLNYMDTEHQAGLEGCRLAGDLGVDVVVMEPVKGGSLAQLPQEVTKPLTDCNPQASTSSWAMRWVGGIPNVKVILSGMTTREQLEDNLSTFASFTPLTGAEAAAVEETAGLLKARLKNGCTGCRYCLPCPAGVDIPQNFGAWNTMAVFDNRKITRRKWKMIGEAARSDRCVACGQCVPLCPQGIPIPQHLARVKEEVEAVAGG